jgi:hypothetical protein
VGEAGRGEEEKRGEGEEERCVGEAGWQAARRTAISRQ